MATLINVRRDVTDAFYRYKMERLQTKVEGKGNGIKTVVVNLSSVAASLARPGAYLIKFFGFELGAQTNIDPPDDRWIINGAHEASKLQDHLDVFINKFVLCKKCKNPETEVVFKDNNTRIILDCKACGQRSDVDLRHKLSGFILKNNQTKKKGKMDKAARRAAKIAKQQNGTNGQDHDNESGEDASSHGSGKENGDGQATTAATPSEDDDDDLARQFKAEAKENDRIASESKLDEWKTDTNDEAVKARQASALSGDMEKKLALNGDEDEEDGEGGGSTVYDVLGDWIQEEASEKGGIDAVDDIKIYVKAKELGIETKHRTVQVLAQSIFNENIISQIGKRKGMLKRMITSERHEKALLGGTERLLGQLAKDNPDVYDKIVKILQLYYQHDLVTEEVVTKWGSKASRKYVDIATSKKVRKAAEPFITWLAEAEEEDSDDE